MLFYKCLKISLINFLNLPKKGAPHCTPLLENAHSNFFLRFPVLTQTLELHDDPTSEYLDYSCKYCLL